MDQFLFSALWGPDTVTDFEDGVEKLDLSATGLSFTDLTIVNTIGGTLISDPTDGNRIFLEGYTASRITEEDFVF